MTEQNRLTRGLPDKLALSACAVAGYLQHMAWKSKTQFTWTRSIIDQQTWLEEWNRYASARIAYDPDIALSLVKYQTLMAMLFRQFTPKACIEYDRLFRQAAGRDAYLSWDCLNNQIFVYTFTPAHAHTPEVRDQTSACRDAIQQPTQDHQFQRDQSAAGWRTPTTRILPWPTTKTNCFQQCHPRRIQDRNLQAVQRREVHSLRLPVCPLVLDAWLPRVTPGQRVSKTPQMSSAELEHPYDMLNLSVSLQDILTKLGSPSCLLQLK